LTPTGTSVDDQENRITYFIRLKSNRTLQDLIEPHLKWPVRRPPKSGIQTKLIDFYYQAGSRDRPRRVICKIEWHEGELFPRIGFIVTNSRLAGGKVLKVYNGGAEIENRIKEWKNTLGWDKTNCTRFEANEARLKMGVLAYNLLHMLRREQNLRMYGEILLYAFSRYHPFIITSVLHGENRFVQAGRV